MNDFLANKIIDDFITGDISFRMMTKNTPGLINFTKIGLLVTSLCMNPMIKRRG